MKIAILGSAPSSLHKAPFGDMSWKIWACSPGAYPRLTRIDEFFEVHRWEPGVVGKPETQKPWFSPEYVQWLKTVPPTVWVSDPDALKDIGAPRAKPLPWMDLCEKYGHYVWTSTVSYMLAMAIDRIMAARAERAAAAEAERVTEEARIAAGGEPITNGAGVAQEPDCIGLWGVDMAANEELYTSQRAACQFFLQVITGLEIEIFLPPESDLQTPPPMYGVSEISHRAIKWTERKRELEGRLAYVKQQENQAARIGAHLEGAIDDLDYHMKMWMHQGEDTQAFQFDRVFPQFAEAKMLGAELKAVKSIAASAVMNADAVAAQAVPAAAADLEPGLNKIDNLLEIKPTT